MTENKYLRKDSRLFHYTPLPVSLLHENIGSTALIIYSVLLGRAMLSLKNGWIDEMGNVYIRYTNKSLAEDVGRSVSTVKSALHELEVSDLIVRKRVNLTTKNIFVKVPECCLRGENLPVIRTDNNPQSGRNSDLCMGEKQTANKKKNKNISSKYQRQEGESF